MPPTVSLLDAALAYAARGWPVLPLHTVGKDGCSCRARQCGSPGKHPLTRHGVRDASTDPSTIRGWWRRWPDANVGIATGRVVAVDIDGDAGEASLAAIEIEHGELPVTLEAETGSGGRHLIFQHPGGVVKNRVKLAPGLDVRSHGGYIVVAPSLHATGRRYRWSHDVPVAELGGHPLADLLRQPRSSPPPPSRPAPLATSPTRDVARARGILRSICQRISGLQDGRRQALIDGAHQLGGYVHLGLPASEIEAALLEAAHACGAHTKHDVVRHIRYGLETGQQKPLPLPPDDGPPPPPEPARPRRGSGPPPQDPGPPPPPGVLARLEQAVLAFQLGDKDSRGEVLAELLALADELGAAWASNEKEILGALAKMRAIPGHAKSLDDLQRLILAAHKRSQEDQRPQHRVEAGDIVLGPDIDSIEEQGIAALARRDRALFQRAGRLIQVVVDPETEHMTTAPVDAYHLRARLSRVATWKAVRQGRDGEALVQVPPPTDIARGILSRGSWRGIRPLAGIVHEPILRRDGTVLQTPGYDSEAKVLYEPTSWFPEVPAHPSLEEAQESCEALLDLVYAFPFANDAARLGFVAAVLTPLARYAFDGPAPWFMWTANVRGTGKSLQASVAALIATGELPAAFSPPSADDEMRKLLTSVAMAGRRLVLLDNITGEVGWGSLDAVLTSNRHGDRVLGQSAHIDLEMRTVFYGTVNNPTFRADTSRRVLPIPLDSPREDPENRTADEFSHPDLRAHVAAHRHELVVRALTILRAYCAAGRPRQPLAPWGSFEAWSGLVRGAIVWMGYPDPHANVGALAEVDLERLELERLVMGLRRLYRDDWFTVRDLVGELKMDRMGIHSDVEAAVLGLIDDERLNERKIGRKLVKLRNRVVPLDGGRVRIRAQLNRKSKVYEYRIE